MFKAVKMWSFFFDFRLVWVKKVNRLIKSIVKTNQRAHFKCSLRILVGDKRGQKNAMSSQSNGNDVMKWTTKIETEIYTHTHNAFTLILISDNNHFMKFHCASCTFSML